MKLSKRFEKMLQQGAAMVAREKEKARRKREGEAVLARLRTGKMDLEKVPEAAQPPAPDVTDKMIDCLLDLLEYGPAVDILQALRHDDVQGWLAQAILKQAAMDGPLNWISHPEYVSAEVVSISEEDVVGKVFYRDEEHDMRVSFAPSVSRDARLIE